MTKIPRRRVTEMPGMDTAHVCGAQSSVMVSKPHAEIQADHPQPAPRVEGTLPKQWIQVLLWPSSLSSPKLQRLHTDAPTAVNKPGMLTGLESNVLGTFGYIFIKDDLFLLCLARILTAMLYLFSIPRK